MRRVNSIHPARPPEENSAGAGIPTPRVRRPVGAAVFLPAAGIGNNTNLNNAGNNGYYWSSTLNANNPAEAWNLNFNDGNQNVNGNNRCVGMPVRPLQHLP